MSGCFALFAEQGPCVEQQVESFVVSYETEKHRIAQSGVEPQQAAGLFPFDFFAVVRVHRMRREDGRFVRSERLQVAVHLFGHVDEPVDRSEEVTGQQRVHRPFFLRNDVVEQRDGFDPFSPRDPAYGAQGRGHLRNPIANDHRVGPFAPYFQTGADPTQRIDRIQHPRNVESFRRRAVRILALTWE